MQIRTSAILLFLVATSATAAFGAEPSAPGVELFENEIRPLLVERCYKCHSSRADKFKGGLSLETREDALRGGDSGPAIVPGKPDESLLLKALRYEDVEMPPDGKLSNEQIAAVEKWIRLGAPDPRRKNDGGRTNAEGRRADPAKHWAFQPVRKVEPPAVPDIAWNQSPIDRFIYTRLAENGLQPSPATDAHTLIRRATFDLIGLPPTYDEVEAFEAESARDRQTAFENLIDRLLASPQYGERWARHWLDVARYADTKGYNLTNERGYPYAYTYRDYVIGALNDDKPFDRFVLEQLAADQLDLGDNRRPLAALGFLTVGRRYLQEHLIIDDRIDVVTRGLMGLTVACARCHDHKFDPIATKDYYALYGVFDSCFEPDELPVLAEPIPSPQYDAYKTRLAALEAERDSLRQKIHGEILDEIRSRAADYLMLVARTLPNHREENVEPRTERGRLKTPIVNNWRRFLSARKDDPIWRAWHRFAAVPQAEFEAKSAAVVDSPDVRQLPSPLRAAVEQPPPQSMAEVARRYGQVLEAVYAKSKADAAGLTVDEKQLLTSLTGPDAPTSPPLDQTESLVNIAQRNALRAAERKIESHNLTSPGAPPRAMVLLDKERGHNVQVFVRGNPDQRGEIAPRRLPEFLAHLGGPRPDQPSSGRLELARAIVHSDNPLTARVIVNRVWQHHFGVGLVPTPSNFGALGERPTHPELLDYLAARFVEEGWSLQKLHRWIMLSQAYRQSSAGRADALQIDPANRLLWKMPRRRLEFEPMRDALLTVGGNLDRSIGGRPFNLIEQPNTPRRTIYAQVDRYDLPRLFGVFDFANPDVTIATRSETTIPQQALFDLNSPFMLRQSQLVAERTANVAEDADIEARVRRLFRIVFARQPDELEVRWCAEFFRTAPQSPSTNLAQALLMSNEFIYID